MSRRAAMPVERDPLCFAEIVKVISADMSGSDLELAIGANIAENDPHVEYSLRIRARFTPGPSLNRRENETDVEFELDAQDFARLHDMLTAAINNASKRGILPKPKI